MDTTKFNRETHKPCLSCAAKGWVFDCGYMRRECRTCKGDKWMMREEYKAGYESGKKDAKVSAEAVKDSQSDETKLPLVSKPKMGRPRKSESKAV